MKLLSVYWRTDIFSYLILFRFVNWSFHFFHVCRSARDTLIVYWISYPDSQSCRDRFWAEHITNFCWQKGNKFHTESVISDDVGKLLSQMWQSLLTCYASRLVAETDLSTDPELNADTDCYGYAVRIDQILLSE